MLSVDLLRYVFFVIFGVGVAFMFATNIIAFKILRPPKRFGFLWWHVTTISISFLCFGAIAIDRTLSKLINHADFTWQTAVTLFGAVTFTAAQAIIFNVERGRLIQKKAMAQHLIEPLGTPGELT